jgi:hypothetical protein
MWGAAGNLKPKAWGSLVSLRLRTEQNGCASIMVSDSLTVGL